MENIPRSPISPGHPLVTIIVVTYNSRKHFSRLFASLASQTERQFGLIIWDNASAPEERPKAHDFPDAVIIQSEENVGFASANNQAVEQAKSQFVVLLNPDAFPSSTWLETLIEAARRNTQAAAIGSTQIMAEQPDLYDGMGDSYHAFGIPWRGGHGLLRLAEPKSGETFSVCAAAALYRREAWLLAGGFDADFFCFVEDVDLGFRLRLAGYTCVQEAKAVVHHVGGASASRRSYFALYFGRRNRIWTFVKNMPPQLLLFLAPGHLAFTALTLVLAVLAPHSILPTWRAVRDTFSNWRTLMSKRRLVQATRKIGVRKLVVALTWSPLVPAFRAPKIW